MDETDSRPQGGSKEPQNTQELGVDDQCCVCLGGMLCDLYCKWVLCGDEGRSKGEVPRPPIPGHGRKILGPSPALSEPSDRGGRRTRWGGSESRGPPRIRSAAVAGETVCKYPVGTIKRRRTTTTGRLVLNSLPRPRRLLGPSRRENEWI